MDPSWGWNPRIPEICFTLLPPIETIFESPNWLWLHKLYVSGYSYYMLLYGFEKNTIKLLNQIWFQDELYGSIIPMNIHKSQLFWCEQKRYKVLAHPHICKSAINYMFLSFEGVFIYVYIYILLFNIRRDEINPWSLKSFPPWILVILSYCSF